MARIEVSCPNCGARYTVEEAHIGKKGRCKNCATPFALRPAAGGAAHEHRQPKLPRKQQESGGTSGVRQGKTVVPDTAVCDVCGGKVSSPEGYLLTTTQVVVSPEYWQCYYRLHEDEFTALGCSSYEALCTSSLLRRACCQRVAGQQTVWIACERCIPMFSVDRERSRGYAERWWRSGRTFQPPGTGAAHISAINLGDGKIMLPTPGRQESPAAQRPAPVTAAEEQNKRAMGHCELCGSDAEGRNYRFFYGKCLGTEIDFHEKRGWDLERRSYTLFKTSYAIAGQSSAFICYACLRKRKKHLYTGLRTSLPGVGLLILLRICRGAVRRLPGWASLACGLLFMLSLGASLVGACFLLRGLRDSFEAGNELAIEAKRREYEARGYDALLTPSAHRRLR